MSDKFLEDKILGWQITCSLILELMETRNNVEYRDKEVRKLLNDILFLDLERVIKNER